MGTSLCRRSSRQQENPSMPGIMTSRDDQVEGARRMGSKHVGGRVAHLHLEAALAQQLPHEVGYGRLVVAHAHPLRAVHPARPFPSPSPVRPW